MFLILVPIFFASGIYAGYVQASTGKEFSEEIFFKGKIYYTTTILFFLFSIVLDIVTAKYLYKQKVSVVKSKLEKVYTITGVVFVLIVTFFSSQFQVEKNPNLFFDNAMTILTIVAFIFVNKNVFKNSGKFVLGKISW